MTPAPDSGPWWRGLSRYHAFALAVAGLGWMFDCLDQQLFNLARVPAMQELLPGATETDVKRYGGYATSVFLVGWAVGGLWFGALGDRIGRARTMVWTILLYSVCTGLSALSTSFFDFALYRFLTGLGVGGEFAVGAALVAEVFPQRARSYALGLLQSCSTIGNMLAALLNIAASGLESSGTIGSAWRWLFVVGALPALLALGVRRRLEEPETWRAVRAKGGAELGSYRALFAHPRWRRNALVGVTLACAGVIGLWGIGFFSIDLQRAVLRREFEAEGVAGAELTGRLTLWSGITSMVLNAGGYFGILAFSPVAERIGRRPTFALAFVGAAATTALVFSSLETRSDLFWMVPLMGFFQLALFGGYAIYLPELFPTSLRSTGTSFCYNVGRLVAALGPAALGQLTAVFATHQEPLRPAGLIMCAAFGLGLIALPFAPETRGQPLPE